MMIGSEIFQKNFRCLSELAEKIMTFPPIALRTDRRTDRQSDKVAFLGIPTPTIQNSQ